MIELPDKWIWDSWYAHDGERWHAFFLQAPKSIGDPELRHWNVSVGHATSTDLRDWTHLGTCLEPAPGPAWNDYTTWTGSVVRGDDGLWHLFYTASSRAEDGLKQRIGHATGTDLHDWARAGAGPCLDLTGPNASHYEEYGEGVWHDRAFRDPWVMRDPEGDGWLMFFTARATDRAEPNDGGAIALATSPDLREWTLEPPVHVGGFGQLEVPQVFERGGRWYCLFCTDAEHWSAERARAVPGGPVTGTHYLLGEGPRGPWRIAPGPFLDGSMPPLRYASRILDTPDGLRLVGFEHRPNGTDFVGRIMDPVPVEVGADGSLSLALAKEAAE